MQRYAMLEAMQGNAVEVLDDGAVDQDTSRTAYDA